MLEISTQPVLNQPKKDYHQPMHTAEHILNRTMDNLFKCGRCFSAHIEEKKSKCDYKFESEAQIPNQQQLQRLENTVNAVIEQNLPVTWKIVSRAEAAKVCDLSKLPPDASEMLRLVYVGDYDVCPCIGAHVENTSQIGRFKIISSSYSEGIFRLRWKLEKN
ncbi:MAG: hypothetical protein MJ196_11925 [Treponemataceae bacterium]|nr:hypothetical protein [Treponemataceae bacterium]